MPHLDTLFITLPIAWKGILAQYAGRIQREWSNKKVIQVYDYINDFPTLKRIWKKRENGYKALGYRFDEQRSLSLLLLTVRSFELWCMNVYFYYCEES
jgi:superfamily II DNA or RNA helicase